MCENGIACTQRREKIKLKHHDTAKFFPFIIEFHCTCM